MSDRTYEQGVRDAAALVPAPYAKARILALIDQPTPAVTVEAAARLLLDEWRESKTTDADEKAQDQADIHECDVDAGQIVEAWLRALAGDTTPEPAEHNPHRARGGYTGGV